MPYVLDLASACACIKMTAVIEHPHPRLPSYQREHEEYRFLHYVGKMNEVWTESTHVVMKKSLKTE